MFSGPSGTGKTLAAEVLAGELQLDLHRVDLASVVSKWVGETEKHLRQVFDAADCGGTLLLFDEADALFGRRSEVATATTATPTSRCPTYCSASSSSAASWCLPPTWDRRSTRRSCGACATWCSSPTPTRTSGRSSGRGRSRRTWPPGVSTSNGLLAVDLTGGDITSVAAHAVLLAAAEDAPVRMDHIRAAAVAELVKLERPLAELGAW